MKFIAAGTQNPKNKLNEAEKIHHLTHSRVPYIYDVFIRKKSKGCQLVVLAAQSWLIDRCCLIIFFLKVF